MKEAEIKKLQEDNEFLRKEVERLKDELVRMVSRNLDYQGPTYIVYLGTNVCYL